MREGDIDVRKVGKKTLCCWVRILWTEHLYPPIYMLKPQHSKRWYLEDLPGDSDSKESAYNAGDPGSVPGLGKSPEEGNGNSL